VFLEREKAFWCETEIKSLGDALLFVSGYYLQAGPTIKRVMMVLIAEHMVVVQIGFLDKSKSRSMTPRSGEMENQRKKAAKKPIQAQ